MGVSAMTTRNRAQLSAPLQSAGDPALATEAGDDDALILEPFEEQTHNGWSLHACQGQSCLSATVEPCEIHAGVRERFQSFG